MYQKTTDWHSVIDGVSSLSIIVIVKLGNVRGVGGIQTTKIYQLTELMYLL
jgi:hypothetical protein